MAHRVYFNRRSDYPFIWSVDDGNQSTEVKVKDVVIKVQSCTASGPGDNENSPTVWIEVNDACLTIRDDVAYLEP